MPSSANLVHETSTTTGSGSLTLANVNGKQSFNTAFSTGGTNTFEYFISNQVAAEWERGLGHLSASTTLVRDTVLESTNSNAAVSFSAGTKDVMSDIPAARQGGYLWHVKNGKIVESHASNAATFAIKTLRGNDPSPKEAVTVDFMDGTERRITAALSITISSGSTMGASNATPFRLWFPIIDDGGVIRLGVQNCSDATNVYGLPANGVLSSTAEGGAGAADNPGVTYTDTAVSSKQYVVVGFADYDSGITTAGTWAASPTRIQLFSAGMPLPGSIVQRKSTTPTANFTTSSVTYVNTGTTIDITPTSAINLIEVTAFGAGDTSAAGRVASLRLSRGTTANTNMFGNSGVGYDAGARMITSVSAKGMDKPATTSTTTYAVQFRDDTGGGTNWGANGNVVFLSAKELVG